MTPEVCRAYARYNSWMNAKIYTTAALLSDEERKRDCGAFFGSIHNLLNHLLVADRIWLGRLTGRVPEPGFMGWATHHRGQITTLLFQAGHDPGATDLFAMLNEEAR